MEIQLMDVMVLEPNKYHFSSCLPLEKIIGIYGPIRETFFKTIQGLVPIEEGVLFLGDKKIAKENTSDTVYIRKQIGYIPLLNDHTFYTKSAKEEAMFLNHCYRLGLKNINTKIETSFALVGLAKEDINKPFFTMSLAEQKLAQIACCLLSNPSILLFEEPMVYFDFLHQKKLWQLFAKLTKNHHKTIVIGSDDVNMLYAKTEWTILLNDKGTICEDKSAKIFTDIPLLKKHQIAIPDLVSFTEKARKMKKVRLSYHRDLLDLIKDIYKHV